MTVVSAAEPLVHIGIGDPFRMELLVDVALDAERLHLLHIPGPWPEPDPVQDVDDRFADLDTGASRRPSPMRAADKPGQSRQRQQFAWS